MLITITACVAVPALMIVTGRVSYTLARSEGIEEHGLDKYEESYQESDQWLSVALGLVFPLVWAVGLVFGLAWLLRAAVTGRPRRSRVEKLELLKRRELDIKRRERELGLPSSRQLF